MWCFDACQSSPQWQVDLNSPQKWALILKVSQDTLSIYTQISVTRGKTRLNSQKDRNARLMRGNEMQVETPGRANEEAGGQLNSREGGA